MIAEITSAPEEPYLPKTWIWASAAFMLGLLGAEAGVGAMAAVVGTAVRSGLKEVPPSWIFAISVIALAYGFRELGIVRMPMPQNPWQVPVQWSRHGKVAQGFSYGVVLGTEVSTFIPYATFYLLLLVEASVRPALGAAIGLTYGFARGISVLSHVCNSRLRTWRRLVTEEERVTELGCRTDRIVGARYLAHIVNGVALLVIGQLFLGTLWRLA